MKAVRRFIPLWFLAVMLVSVFSVHAQDATPAPGRMKCGDILDAEMDPKYFYQHTMLQVQAGTKIDLTIQPLGSGFDPYVFLVDGGGGEITRLNNAGLGVAEEFSAYPISSSNPIVRIMGGDPRRTTEEINKIANNMSLGTIMRAKGVSYDTLYTGKWFGAYTLTLSCTLRDGTRIEAGQAPPTGASSPVITSFTGTGFPGLPPVDFSNVAKIPMIAGTPMTGAVTPTGTEILGYTLDGKAGNTVELGVNRLSGNLNLGVVVLSADNKVVFQASMVTSSALTTTFTLPSDGQYTIGVFRIDLLPPDSPEPTAFQVMAKVS
jgi:hypothetical protein